MGFQAWLTSTHERLALRLPDCICVRLRPSAANFTLVASAPLRLGLLCSLIAAPAAAQKAPEMGYVYPPGGRAGTTVEVRLGGYDWTPDMQFFVHDPRIKLEVLGPPGAIHVPPPPYWFGSKAYLPALPLPREIPARLTIPAHVPPGPVYWRAANANGGTTPGVFWVGGEPETQETARRKGPQELPTLPQTVSGRLFKIAEVDRYRFTAPKDGPVTLELTARRLASNFNGVLAVHDESGRLVADTADTSGDDAGLTFHAKAGARYVASLNDVDFRGDRSYVYRLRIAPGPRVLAAFPLAGRRGETRAVEFVVDTGKAQPERLTREVRFPTDPGAASLPYRLETAAGPAPVFTLGVSDLPETVEGAQRVLTLPAGITGALDAAGEDRFECPGKKGETWSVAVEARKHGSPLDVAVAILGPDGKEAARSDDLPETTDAGLQFTVPADGTYTVVISDMSGRTAHPAPSYRLSIQAAPPGFSLQAPGGLNVLIGGKAELVVKAARSGGFKEPIALSVSGLPEGASVPSGLVIPAGAAELKVPVTVAADSPAAASLVSLTGTAMVEGKSVTRAAQCLAGGGNLAPRSPEESRVDSLLLAVTMKPRCKVEPVDKDGGRTVHRGTTYPAEVILQRLEGYEGPITLEMSARQSYTCMGIHGPDIVVAPGIARTAYPCFMPEWLETSRTSRMILNGVVKVADPRGNVRYVVSRMDGRITMSMEGALLKITHAPAERTVRAGATFRIPIKVARSAKLPEVVRVELRAPEGLEGLLKMEPVVLASDRSEVEVAITSTLSPELLGEQNLTLRATAMQAGNLPVVSETQVPVVFEK